MSFLHKNFLSEADTLKVTDAIRTAENRTSGEIKVHMEPYCKMDVLDRASDIFGMLHMHETALRNGVLFYLAYEDKKFAVIGDAGINAKVAANFWDEIKDTMREHFVQGAFAEGLAKGITMAGEQLAANFPFSDDDKNELSDDISYGGPHA